MRKKETLPNNVIPDVIRDPGAARSRLLVTHQPQKIPPAKNRRGFCRLTCGLWLTQQQQPDLQQ
ncbi:MAG: hypothetical protein Pyrs2KO_11950 [Pyruvatibacter sp.]